MDFLMRLSLYLFFRRYYAKDNCPIRCSTCNQIGYVPIGTSLELDCDKSAICACCRNYLNMYRKGKWLKVRRPRLIWVILGRGY